MGRLVVGCRCGYTITSKPEATSAEAIAKAMKALEAEARRNHKCSLFGTKGGPVSVEDAEAAYWASDDEAVKEPEPHPIGCGCTSSRCF